MLVVSGVGIGLAALARFGPLWSINLLISLAAPAVALGAMGAAIAALAIGRKGRRRWLGPLAALIAAAFLADCLYGTLQPQWRAPAPADRPLRIVEFNVWKDNRDPAAASRWILAQRPDIVVLLEAAGAGALIADGLGPALPYQATCRGSRRCSTRILSRLPPIAVRPLAKGDADNRRSLSAVLMTFGGRRRPVSVLAVHLSRPPWVAHQRIEIEMLIARMQAEPKAGLIVTGDFNAPLWSPLMRRLAQGLDVRPIGGERPSWPAPPSGMLVPTFLPIDHALLGAGWSAARQVRGPSLGSDHYPLLIVASPAP